MLPRGGWRRRSVPATLSCSSPPEWSPLTATLLATVLEEAGVPAGVFNVVHGFGETAGAPLVAPSRRQPDLLHGRDGDRVRRSSPRARPTLKRSSVELGGKSPVVVFEDADTELVRRCRARADLHHERSALHGGLAVARRRSRSTSGSSQAVADRARNIRVGDPFDPRTELGPLIQPRAPRARARLHRRRRASEGARVLAGGGRPTHLPDGNFLEATVIADVDEHDARLPGGDLRPVLVAMPFGDEAEAVRLANATQYGLAAYVWTQRRLRARTAWRTRSTPACAGSTPRTCATCARRSAASRRAASAARAATTPSSSTARLRPSTSRWARTTSRGSALATTRGISA